MRVALVYDRVNKWGGAERVLLALHELFPDAPLYTSVYNPKTAGWAEDFIVKTSFLQKFPFASSSHEYYALLMPKAFESFSFEQYELVISVSSEASKGIITGPNTLHIDYCLTPTRYLWSGYKEYFKNPFFSFLTKPFIKYLREWDKKAAKRPDAYIAISQEVKRRIKKYYGREASLIYPPVSLVDTVIKMPQQKGEYFLVVSRLVGYKRVDIAIKACNELHIPLKIVGIGAELQALKKIAGPTIEFLGLLTEESLIQYYKGCKALLFAGIEDFGITVVEAQGYGKPVIAFKGGGALETIVVGKTGIFFFPQKVQELKKAIQLFEKKRFDSENSHINAKKFSLKEFRKQFMKEILSHIKEREANS